MESEPLETSSDRQPSRVENTDSFLQTTCLDAEVPQLCKGHSCLMDPAETLMVYCLTMTGWPSNTWLYIHEGECYELLST